MKTREFKVNVSVFSLVILFLVFLLCSSGYANLLVNGSFEQGSPAPGTTSGSFITFSPGATNIDGWIVTRGQIEYYGSIPTCDGARCLELDGLNGVGGVMQSFPTNPGTEYIVTFDLSGNYARLDKGPLIKQLRVTAAGQFKDFFYEKPEDPSPLEFVSCAWSFTAVSDVTTIELYSLDDPSSWCGPLLDNVVVVPEPGALLLLGLGGLLIRRR